LDLGSVPVFSRVGFAGAWVSGARTPPPIGVASSLPEPFARFGAGRLRAFVLAHLVAAFARDVFFAFACLAGRAVVQSVREVLL
jgi:hypothetical protein